MRSSRTMLLHGAAGKRRMTRFCGSATEGILFLQLLWRTGNQSALLGDWQSFRFPSLHDRHRLTQKLGNPLPSLY